MMQPGAGEEEGGQGEASQAELARRTRLRAYQEELLERMQAAKSGSGERVHQLGLGIGGARWLLDLTEAGEIVPLGALTPVPLTRPWYLGLVNVRGALLGVIDLARYLDPEAPASPASTGRLVTFSPALGFNCALRVDQVFGLRQAGAMEREGDTLRDAEGNTWKPLSLAALVREERFLHVGM
ncbi:chemotaxis protein CheW [Massilia sp. ST3]|uniref:chemotaxis protein CheW n=1 Tax=Massilia sp. ST3 TaxID=2824903 RepID=UPI0027D9BEFB|nr:chemotaxis protein CheW [Massilia sp. ST3]